MSLVVNLFGGPGCGKSSTMAGVFAELKWRGRTVEMASEWVKQKVWGGHTKVLEDQVYIFGKQSHIIHDLTVGKVEAIITDAPLLLSVGYGKMESPEFHQLVLEAFQRSRNLNIFLNRIKPYDPNGRMQTEEEAQDLDRDFKKLLERYSFPYFEFDACRESVFKIADLVEHRL